MLEKAKTIQEQLIGRGPGELARRQRLVEMINALGFVYFKRSDFPDALRSFQQVQEICVSLLNEITDGPKPVKLLSLLALSHYNMATIQFTNQEKEKALQSFERFLEYRRDLVELHPSVSTSENDSPTAIARLPSRSTRPDTVKSHCPIYNTPLRSSRNSSRPSPIRLVHPCWGEHGMPSPTFTTRRGTIKRRSPSSSRRSRSKKTPSKGPPTTTSTRPFFAFIWRTSESNTSTWVPLRLAGRITNVRIEIRRNLHRGHPENLDYAQTLIGSLFRLGSIERHMGDPAAALKSFTEARDVAERFLKTTPDQLAMRCRLAEALTHTAWAQFDMKQNADALGSLQHAVEALNPLAKSQSKQPEWRESLTEALQARAAILRLLNQDLAAEKIDTERLALWKDQPVERLAHLALAQTIRAALIGYGKISAGGEAGPPAISI